MNLEQWLSDNLLAILIPLFSSFFAYLLSRQKNRVEIIRAEHEAKKILSEAKKVESETATIATSAANNAVMLWQGLYERLSKDNLELKLELEQKIERLSQMVTDLKKQIAKYRRTLYFLLNSIRDKNLVEKTLDMLDLESIEDLQEDV